jgi:hypothetical protein
MGSQKGIVRLSGQFDDLQLSIDGKKGIAKLSVPVSKERIRTADEFVNTRKVNMEFQAAAMAVDAVQDCLRGKNATFGDRYLRSRLQTVMIAAVRRGAGNFGERALEVLPNVLLLNQFPLNQADRFKNWFRAPYDVQINADRNTATLVVPAFDIDFGTLKVPQGATHFRVFVCVGVLSDLQYSGSDARYEAVNVQMHGRNGEGRTGWMPSSGQNAGFQVVAPVGGLPILPTTAGLVVSLGVEFCFMVNTIPQLKAEGNAMDILDVF